MHRQRCALTQRLQHTDNNASMVSVVWIHIAQQCGKMPASSTRPAGVLLASITCQVWTAQQHSGQAMRRHKTIDRPELPQRAQGGTSAARSAAARLAANTRVMLFSTAASSSADDSASWCPTTSSMPCTRSTSYCAAGRPVSLQTPQRRRQPPACKAEHGRGARAARTQLCRAATGSTGRRRRRAAACARSCAPGRSDAGHAALQQRRRRRAGRRAERRLLDAGRRRDALASRDDMHGGPARAARRGGARLRDEAERPAGPAGARGAADAVHVVRRQRRQLEVDHQVDGRDVQAAAGHVRGEQHRHAARLEPARARGAASARRCARVARPAAASARRHQAPALLFCCAPGDDEVEANAVCLLPTDQAHGQCRALCAAWRPAVPVQGGQPAALRLVRVQGGCRHAQLLRRGTPGCRQCTQTGKRWRLAHLSPLEAAQPRRHSSCTPLATPPWCCSPRRAERTPAPSAHRSLPRIQPGAQDAGRRGAPAAAGRAGGSRGMWPRTRLRCARRARPGPPAGAPDRPRARAPAAARTPRAGPPPSAGPRTPAHAERALAMPHTFDSEHSACPTEDAQVIRCTTGRQLARRQRITPGSGTRPAARPPAARPGCASASR